MGAAPRASPWRARAIVIAAVLAGGAAAAEPGVSDWSRTPHSAARLLAAGPAPSGGAEQDAAIEIRLAPGYLTYWRQPGDAGLPPSLTTSGSDNVAAVAIDYPAPGVFDEAGAKLFGYRDAVTFPLRVTLADPARPATLAIALDYAVCASLCLPGHADLRLALPRAPVPSVAATVAAARAAVPRASSLGAGGPLSVLAVQPAPTGAAGAALAVVVAAQSPANLFGEGPEGWFFTVADPSAGAPGTLVFPVTVAERPREAATGPVALELTLTDPTGAVAVPLHVDVGAARP